MYKFLVGILCDETKKILLAGAMNIFLATSNPTMRRIAGFRQQIDRFFERTTADQPAGNEIEMIDLEELRSGRGKDDWVIVS
jgi:hypothetical protein